MKMHFIPLALALAVAAVVAGCGGSSATKTVTAVRTSVETVTAEAASTDAIVGPSADTPATTDSGTSSTAKILDRTIRQVGGDGNLLFKVTAQHVVPSVAQDYEQPFRPVAGAKLVVITVVVKNNGQASVTPFCGGTDTTLIDTKDRNFDVLDSEMVDMPDNNVCDDLQPGFSSTFNLLFQMPADATPDGVALWDSDDGDDFLGTASWVRFAL